MQFKILFRVVSRGGIKGQSDPATTKELLQRAPDHLVDTLDIQVEHTAKEDVVKVLIERVLFDVKDPEACPGVLLARHTDEFFVDIKPRVIDLDISLFQEAAKVPLPASEIEDLFPMDAVRNVEQGFIVQHLPP